MALENLALCVATYDDAAAAEADLQVLKDAQRSQDFMVVGAVVASRDASGEVTVREHGAASPVGGGAVIGGTGGLVLGLFAPPLLLATAVGAGIGAAIGELAKRHQEKQLGLEVDEYLPAGSSAIIVVVDDTYADRVDKALTTSIKKISKAIDSGDADKLAKALEGADKRVSRAVES